ncbi:Zn-dependent amino-or carboxypeptidase, M28 family [Solimonas aquatica]|uniref:Zn-dependent amino-or carboxypeptidase, M28 family n=2 Tax=Solimonas aquatica TaxID=489703 RepID=A0A1H9CFX2_9GAMM|nr:Zn-dependent amino-or carboxypeptidase, M28 family [Solimonas aquatica]
MRGCAALLLGLSLSAASAQAPAPTPVSAQTMMRWIAQIEAQGERRPGYAADQWTERWAQRQFQAFGLEQVRLEPVPVMQWTPRRWSLRVWHPQQPQKVLELPSYPVPMSAAGSVEADLRLEAEGVAAEGSILVSRSRLLSMAHSQMRQIARWDFDPLRELDGRVQTLPVPDRFANPLDQAVEARALGLIGILDFPWETDRYFYPYDGKARAIPGVWLSAANGKRLLEFMAQGPTRARLELQRDLVVSMSHNLIGTLPGRSSEWIVIGSHHDGPWQSAVEDASGTALVMAQARYWSRLPREQRPFNLMFLLNGGHMSGGAGLLQFAQVHKAFLQQQVVTEIHLEHAAREMRAQDGQLQATGRPEVRWWFTSFVPRLEEVVTQAICAENLQRSLLMPVEGFPEGSRHPPTDAAFFHPLTPIVSFLTAPMYLFDAQDRLDKVDVDSLEPLTRATIRIIQGLDGVSAAQLREQAYQPPRSTPLPSCAS